MRNPSSYSTAVAALGIVAIGLGGAASLLAEPAGPITLARFSTSLVGRTKNQIHNATLSMSKLKSVTLGPGEVFSFNGTVGTYTCDAGYRKAPVSYNGQLIDGWGGGVCQTSTTLYNAALGAGLEVVERTHHRYAPRYAPPGRDAGVAYPNIDLKIRNPYDFPIQIRGSWTSKDLVFVVTAAKRPRELPAITTQVLDRIEPAKIAITGETNRGRARNTGKTGYEVATYRIWRNRRELVSVDFYPAMQKVIEYR